MEHSSALDVADQTAQAQSGGIVSDHAALGPSGFLLSPATSGDPGLVTESASPAAIGPSYNSRALDVAAATVLLALLLPLMAFCAVVVLATSRGPLLFRHQRIGRNGEVFDCLKFRTMVQNADAVIEEALNKSAQNREEWETLQKLRNDPRVTPLGAFLRKYCLDELPQLFNVLGGQMSIVGPRPIVAAEVERYGLNFAAYCSVKPGLTGLWQVSGRHLLSYPERVELDVRYARSRTLPLDLTILWKTVPVVLWGLNE